MNYKKIKNELLKMSYVDVRGIICHSYSTISISKFPSIYMKTISQSHLPSFMILSINHEKLHISKASAMGNFKKYIGALYLNKLTFVQSFHKEYNYVYEFTYELENGTTIAFYINCVFDNLEVVRVVEELKRFKKEIPFYNNYGFTFDPEEWFAKKFNYLNELMINRQLGHLATHIVVYYVLRLFIDEVDKGGILNFFDNSYKFLYDEINVCLDIINNSDINNIMNKAYEILDNYDYDNINLSDEDILKIEELDNEFYQYKDQFLNQIDSYYKQSYKKLTHSGELMIKELHEDNVYSKICEHLKPILTYELNNNNSIQEVSSNKSNNQFFVDLTWEISFDEKESLSNGVELWINDDSKYKLQRGYYCNICNHRITGPLDNSQVKFVKPKKGLFKYFILMSLAFFMSIVFGVIVGFLIFSTFSNSEDDFSSSSFRTSMTIGILFGIVVLIVNVAKAKKD